MKKVINSDSLLSEAIGELRAMYMQHRYVRMSLTTGKQRSLDQNAQLAVWYAQVATELRQQSEAEVKAECKLRIGVPIMRRDDEDFRAMYDRVVKPHDYETKIQMMGWMPLTSLMSTKQLSEYAEEMQRSYKGTVELVFSDGK